MGSSSSSQLEAYQTYYTTSAAETHSNTDVWVYLAIFGFCYMVLNILLQIARREISKPRAAMKRDDFMRDNGYSYEFAFVFKVFDEENPPSTSSINNNEYSMKNIIMLLNQAGFQTSCFYSVQRDEVYVKIRTDIDRLKKEASRIKYKLKLKSERLRLKAQAGKAGLWKPIFIADEYNQSSLQPYIHIYSEYQLTPEFQSLYELYEANEGKKHIFRAVDRIKLMVSIIKAAEQHGGCGFDPKDLLFKKAILAAFPLHDYDTLNTLQRRWLNLISAPSKQPIDEVKDYFGESIGLYFSYLGHYVSFLVIPAVLGLGVFICQKISGRSEFFLMPVFAAFMVIWSTFFVEYWKRLQNVAAMRWGVVGFEDEEQERPQYEGNYIVSPVDGSIMKYFAEPERKKRRNIVGGIVLCCILLVLAIVGATFYLQYILTRPPLSTQLIIDIKITSPINISYIIVPLINAIVIVLANLLYTKIVFKLNDYENHRTDTEYEDNLIAKIFVFQLVNSFAALTYISFIKTYLGITCSTDNCTREAAVTLSTVFNTRIITQIISQVFIRKLNQYLNERRETQGLMPNTHPSPIEQQYVFDEYDPLKRALVDYAGLVIQYGYTLLFVAAFPLAPTLAFVSSYLQLRIDAWKLCQAHRRPIPRLAEDIGMWQDMIEIISSLAVVSNFALIFFTGNYFDFLTNEVRVLLFLLVEHVVFSLKYIVSMIIDDVPVDVDIQLKRNAFLQDKVVFDKPDDIDDDDDNNNKSKNNNNNKNNKNTASNNNNDDEDVEENNITSNIMIETTDYGWDLPDSAEWLLHDDKDYDFMNDSNNNHGATAVSIDKSVKQQQHQNF